MIAFTATILQFAEQGEKTGWSYINIPAKIAQQLKPGNKKAFRVKGRLDDYAYQYISLLPMGDSNFIMAMNATIRRAIKKGKGALVQVQMEVDESTFTPPAELLECLADEPEILNHFNKLPPSHRQYFANWINSAKTETTKAKRIAQTITALSKNYNFGEMMRSIKKNNEDLSV